MTAPLTFAELEAFEAGTWNMNLRADITRADVQRLIDEVRRLHAEAVEGIRSERQRCARIARSWRRLDPMHPVGPNDHAVRGEDTAATAIEQAILDDRGVQ